MKDKRKIRYCLIFLIIVIFSEFILFNKAYKEDVIYKEKMFKNLEPIITEMESRGFKAINEENEMKNGILNFERNSENVDYGYLKIEYDLEGMIKNVAILLEYSTENYSDDIFSEVYYVFSLVGIDLYEDNYIDALNILIENPESINEIDEEISKNEIVINNNIYTFSLKGIKENNERKIQFCLE